MTALTCDEAEDLLGAYALDALPEEERNLMDAHLVSCAKHRLAASELKQVVPLLALAAEDRAPSLELRDRIVRAVNQGTTEPPILARRQLPPSKVARARTGFGGWGWRLEPRIAAIAAAALLALGVGIGIGHFATAQQPVALTFMGNQLAPNSVAHLVYFKAQHRAVLDVTGLPALSPGTVYEMWLFKGGSPIAAGVSGAGGGTLIRALDADLTHYEKIAITIEPGEQAKPTTNPILTGDLAGI